MDKYVNAVLLDSDVRMAMTLFLPTCEQDCAKVEQFFQYGPFFLQRCRADCTHKLEVFKQEHQRVAATLRSEVQACLERFDEHERKPELRQCILPVQRAGMQQLFAAMNKMKERARTVADL